MKPPPPATGGGSTEKKVHVVLCFRQVWTPAVDPFLSSRPLIHLLKRNRQISFNWDLTVTKWVGFRAPYHTATPDFFLFLTFWFLFDWAFQPRITICTPSPYLAWIICTPPDYDFKLIFGLFPKALKWLIAYLSYFSHFAMLKFWSSSLSFHSSFFSLLFSFLAYLITF